MTLDQFDPQVIGPYSIWNSTEVPRLYLRTAHHTQTNQAELFFAGTDLAFSTSKRIPITINPDGNIHSYEIDLSAHPLYTGVITRLRFDPIVVRSPGDRVDLYSLSWNPSVCPADVTPSGGNGLVNIDDLVSILSSFGSCPPPPVLCAADITPPGGNGTVNIDDLVALLSAFGPCAP